MWLILFLLSSTLPSNFGWPCEFPLADPLYDVTANSPVAAIDQESLEETADFEYLSCQAFESDFFAVLAKWEGRALGVMIGRRTDAYASDDDLLQAWLDGLYRHVGGSLYPSEDACSGSLFCGVLKRINLKKPTNSRGFLFSAFNLAEGLIAKRALGFKDHDTIEFGTRIYWNENEKLIDVAYFGNETILGSNFPELGNYSDTKSYCLRLDNPVKISDTEFTGYGAIAVKESQNFCFNLETVFPNGSTLHQNGMTPKDAVKILDEKPLDVEMFKERFLPHWDENENFPNYVQFGCPFYDLEQENSVHYRLMGCQGSAFCHLKMEQQEQGPCNRSRFYIPKDPRRPLCPVAFDTGMRKFISFDYFDEPVELLEERRINRKFNLTVNLTSYCENGTKVFHKGYSTVLILTMAKPGTESKVEEQLFQIFKQNEQHYAKTEIEDSTYELRATTTEPATSTATTVPATTTTPDSEALFCYVGEYSIDGSMKRTNIGGEEKEVEAGEFCYAHFLDKQSDKVLFHAERQRLSECVQGVRIKVHGEFGFCSHPHKFNAPYNDGINYTKYFLEEDIALVSDELEEKRVCPQDGHQSVECAYQCYAFLDDTDRIISGCANDIGDRGLVCRLRSGSSRALNDECGVVVQASSDGANRDPLYKMAKYCCVEPRSPSNASHYYEALRKFMRDRTDVGFSKVSVEAIYEDFIEDHVVHTYAPRPTSFGMDAILEEFDPSC
ncbi:unnamed protein product [Bursaphelenchus xylophilus]|uniref:(pine wood nematode) hypothetical protein n=1 Tax=Bursaphelenchus xylophilus TaxID=6326 RepID=A0A1I7S6M8_BURXY|nr:unnamed protein product [Bursaphelenchus xylophilus]CAG9120590.1 unnamed protein product [Bursaphelenchus xylophilus]